MVWSALFLSMFLGASRPAPAEVLLEREHLATFVPELRVFDGAAWERGDGLTGALRDGQVSALARLVAAAYATPSTAQPKVVRVEMCDAAPARLAIGDKRWSWNEGCGDYPSQAIERLLHFLRRQSHRDHGVFGSEALIILREGVLRGRIGESASDEIIVRRDGRWARRVGDLETRGVLGALALAELTTLARETKVTFDDRGATCEAIPSAWHQVWVPGGGEAIWRSPCSSRPGAATGVLAAAVRRVIDATRGGLAPERADRFMLAIRSGPLLTANGVWIVHSETLIFADGAWRDKGGRSGRLDAATVESLRSHIAQTRFEMAPFDPGRVQCAAVSVSYIEAEAGDGRVVRWSGPCAPGPDASVYTLVQLVHELVGR